MKFKINQSFAANYDERRRKEELSKLKSKYGEVPLEEEDGASSTESETDEDWERNVLNDTRDLELLEALKSGDPRIKDPSYRWFSSSESESPQGSKVGRKERSKSLFLRDLERRRLIGSAKAEEEEEEEEEEERDQAMDQGNEGSLKASTANASRNAFKINVSDDDDDDGDTELFSLGADVSNTTIASTDVIMKQTDKNADEVLLSYIKMITKKANEPKVDHHNSSADDEREDDSGEEELFFSKGAEFEEQWNNRFSEPTDLESLYPRTFAVFRSEEADRDFIKSHPRTIADSMRQPREGKLSRSEKNRARRDRVRREKEQKLARIGAELDAKVEAEIRELRRLKMETADERVEKIRRTADNMKLQLDAKFLEEDWDSSKHDQYIQRAFDEEYDEHAQEPTKPVFSDDDELDEDMVDWDTWKPTNTTNSAGSSANPRPQNSAADLMEVDEEEERGRRRRRKRRHRAVGFRGALERASKRGRLAGEAGRFSREDFPEGFDEFIDKVYAFDCEDIITGHGEEQQDVKCRFRYRSTVPNDFGLSVDEILSAPARELNSWASLKKVVQYRTEDEEARDKKIYGSSHRQTQKGRLLPTVFTPLSDNDGVGDEEEKTEGETVVRKKKKKKKQKKAALVAAGSQQTTMETDAGDSQPRPKKAWANKQKPYIPKPTDIVSESRLNKLLRANRE